jgi:uncharacterized iron-regulated membrane protein
MKFAYQWHRRLGWLLAPLLAVTALSGVALLWLQPLPASQSSPPPVQAWAQALDQGLTDLSHRHPTAQVDFVNLPRETDAPLRAHLLASPAGEGGWVEIDPVRGTAGALQPDSGHANTLLIAVHNSFLLDDIGPWVQRAVALVALALVAMGLRIWWRVRQLPARSPWRRWHRRIGPLVVLPLAMMLATGFVLRWPELARATLSTLSGEAAGAPRLAAPAAGAPQAATLGQVLTAASAALPQARPTRIYAARDGVLRVRLRGDEWHPIGLNYAYLSAEDASVLRVVRSVDQPLSVRYLGIVYPLHAGWLPGNPGIAAALAARGLWTLFALSLAALAISGAIQRFARK